MADDVFLRLDGIEGESKDQVHWGKIDVLAWTWGASQSGSFHTGGGGGAGKATFKDVTVLKGIDKSSPELFIKLASGKHIKKGQLILRKAGERPLEYLVIHFEDIILTSLELDGSGGEDNPREKLTFNFSKFVIDYSEQDAEGHGASPVKMTWNIAANSK